MKNLKGKWLFHSILGLLLFGFGLSLVGEAIIAKMTTSGDLWWVVYGTLALIVTNSGLCVFGQGVIYRTQMFDVSANTEQKQ
jgi:hypothetical protein